MSKDDTYKSVAERTKDIEAQKNAGERKRSNATINKDSFKEKPALVEEKVENSVIGTIKNAVGTVKDAVGTVKDAIDDSVIGKTLGNKTVQTGLEVGATIGAAIGTGPVGVSVAVVVGAYKIGKIVADTQETRELYQEKKALDTHLACNEIQKETLKKYPTLEVLGVDKKPPFSIEIGKINEKCKNSLQHPTTNQTKIVQGIVSGIVVDKGKEVAIDAVREALTGVASNPTPVGAAKALVNMIKDAKEEYNKAMQYNDAKIEINAVKKTLLQNNIAPYENLDQLKESAREKSINTAALVKLTENEKAFEKIKDNPEAIKERFDKIKGQVAKTIKEVETEHGSIFEKTKAAGKDLIRSTPLGSKYAGEIEFTTPAEIKEKFTTKGFATEPSSFDRAMEAVKKTVNPEYEHKDPTIAKNLAKIVDQADKSFKNNPEDSHAQGLIEKQQQRAQEQKLDKELSVRRNAENIGDMLKNFQKQTPTHETNNSAPRGTPTVQGKSSEKSQVGPLH